MKYAKKWEYRGFTPDNSDMFVMNKSINDFKQLKELRPLMEPIFQYGCAWMLFKKNVRGKRRCKIVWVRRNRKVTKGYIGKILSFVIITTEEGFLLRTHLPNVPNRNVKTMGEAKKFADVFLTKWLEKFFFVQ